MKLGANMMTGLGIIAAIGLVTLISPDATAATTALGGAEMTTPGSSALSTNHPAGRANAMAYAHKVALLQEALDSTGANLRIDGVWGPATERALKHYQRQAGLPVTGKLDQANSSSARPDWVTTQGPEPKYQGRSYSPGRVFAGAGRSIRLLGFVSFGLTRPAWHSVDRFRRSEPLKTRIGLIDSGCTSCLSRTVASGIQSGDQ